MKKSLLIACLAIAVSTYISGGTTTLNGIKRSLDGNSETYENPNQHVKCTSTMEKQSTGANSFVVKKTYSCLIDNQTFTSWTQEEITNGKASSFNHSDDLSAGKAFSKLVHAYEGLQ